MPDNRPDNHDQPARPSANSPWVLDTRELGRRPGISKHLRRSMPVTTALGVPGVITVPAEAEVDVDILLESVVEGVLASGTASVVADGQCGRCLDPLTENVRVEITELFAYPDSTTEETTDEDEVSRLVDDLLDLEPVIRDAIVLGLPQVPLCTPDCAGLCAQCGVKWAELEPGHGHETIDPRWAALVERFGQGRDSQE
ncbi:uncharacterized protein EV191_106184 [Tamaricihabitans halophyticus]|uniref:Metal-binding protein n=1 Tax=Tamaricihabitans halophyticus TaxID=1262583 RepID=A0A4R2QQL1_9PSEU|nr:YceD family protein [Tamaricihabitans halophyticus]TCP52020.1 uncharacterized protein EV191_106184 [Tamaricihabitans halophyticus]